MNVKQDLLNLKGLIFDLDGTLLDTLPGIAQAANSVLIRYNFPTWPEGVYRHRVGDGLTAVLQKSLPTGVSQELAPEVWKDMCDQLMIEYSKIMVSGSAPYAGIVQFLQELNTGRREGPIRLAVVSNKREDFVKVLCAHFFSKIPFEFTLGSVSYRPKKPAVQSLQPVLDSWHFLPEQVAIVGDTASDILVGKKAGLKTVWVSWGFRSADDLQSLLNSVDRPDFIVHRALDLSSLFC